MSSQQNADAAAHTIRVRSGDVLAADAELLERERPVAIKVHAPPGPKTRPTLGCRN
jgi:hypothetical protein